MSLLSPRRSRALAVTASAAVLVVGASLITQATPAYAAAMTISAVAPAKVSAGLANRVVVITGTNFDEDLIAGIKLGTTDTDCALLTSYVVTSATSISVKTPGAGVGGAPSGCAPSSGGTAEAVSVIDIDGTTVAATKASAITFVAPPSIATLSAGVLNPVFTDNSSSSLLGATNQVTQLSAAGGQAIQIKAASDYAFTGIAASGLSGTLGGKALTTVGFLAADGTTTQLASAPGVVGNTWIAKTSAGLTPSLTPTLTITQGTVSRSFTSTDTGLTIVTVPTVTSLDVKFGKVGVATAAKITGADFGTVAADIGVTFCGVAATVSAVTATLITLTTPTAVANVSPGLGSTVYSGVCPVVVTRTVGAGTPGAATPTVSPISAGSAFAFVDR